MRVLWITSPKGDFFCDKNKNILQSSEMRHQYDGMAKFPRKLEMSNIKMKISNIQKE